MSNVLSDATPPRTPTSAPTSPRSLSNARSRPTTPTSPCSFSNGALQRAISGPSAVPMGRSFSGESILTVSSSSSSGGRSMTNKRRGFQRPQGTEFSRSAKSRGSVMALGSIAHLQYFFAKTGLLDGKGGGIKPKKSASNLSVDTSPELYNSSSSSLRSSPELFLPGERDNDYLLESPLGMDDYDFDDSIMLPPTTSTYNPHVEPCTPEPDVEVLRRRLRDALSQTKNAWARAGEIPQEGEDCEDLQHLQGTELCNLGTAAVRAAKTYYCVTDISLLSTKDARTMREEFMAVLGVLRHMVQRKFSGGIEAEEHTAMISWVTCIEEALFEEEAAVAEIRQKGRDWLEGSWDGREYDRFHRFLTYFDSSDESMPPHTSIESAEELPTPFLAAMQSGLRLILIHNAVVRRSKRPFGQIPKFHKEFSKPYRMAENLRYWKKAAEIRFDLRLKFDVMAVVNGTDKGWQDFERDIAIWSECVLVEVRKDWELGEGAASVGQVRANRSNTMMDWDHLEGVSSTESSSAHAAMGKVRANRSSTMMSMKVEVGEHWNPIKYN